ncbi:hypothetical protein [Sphingopyxis panaciterrae]
MTRQKSPVSVGHFPDCNHWPGLKAERRPLLSPSHRQINRRERLRRQLRRLSTFDDRCSYIRRQAGRGNQLPKPGTASTMVCGDGRDGLLRVLEHLPVRCVRLSDELHQLLITLLRRHGRGRWRKDKPQSMTAPHLDDRTVTYGLANDSR